MINPFLIITKSFVIMTKRFVIVKHIFDIWINHNIRARKFGR